MFGPSKLSDNDVLKTVNQRLARTGTGSQSRVTATVRSGTVTLTGTLNYEIQRNALMKAASRGEGVRQVIDQMTLIVKKKV
jgi:osmotically-inducible protein OsmY